MLKQKENYTAKTKILATLGPASDSIETLIALLENGADAFRLNFSHGNYDYYTDLFQKLETVRKKTSVPFSVLVDLQGPKIRIGEVNGTVTLKEGATFEITTDEIIGDENRVSTSYKELPNDVAVGEIILINDGLVKLRVEKIEGNSVYCKVLEGGEISSHKGLNLPGTKLSVPSVTEKDFRDLVFALQHKVDFVALSFVRKAQDIHLLRSWLIERGHKQRIIAKIEKPEAVENFDSILEAADGIMVARGDLGVEMETRLVPIIQKMIIEKSNKAGKLVITATQMLESMIHNAIPTRAEVSDVANAVLDGTDAVMLSGETSVGKHPALVVKTMNEIIKTAELNNPPKRYEEYFVPKQLESKVFDTTAQSVAEVADKLNTKAIVVFTYSGRTAETISKFRPKTPIYAFSNFYETLSRLNLKWGIEPFHTEQFNEKDEGIQSAISLLKKMGTVSEGDLLLFTAVAPVSEKERRSWIHFVVV